MDFSLHNLFAFPINLQQVQLVPRHCAIELCNSECTDHWSVWCLQQLLTWPHSLQGIHTGSRTVICLAWSLYRDVSSIMVMFRSIFQSTNFLLLVLFVCICNLKRFAAHTHKITSYTDREEHWWEAHHKWLDVQAHRKYLATIDISHVDLHHNGRSRINQYRSHAGFADVTKLNHRLFFSPSSSGHYGYAMNVNWLEHARVAMIPVTAATSSGIWDALSNCCTWASQFQSKQNLVCIQDRRVSAHMSISQISSVKPLDACLHVPHGYSCYWSDDKNKGCCLTEYQYTANSSCILSYRRASRAMHMKYSWTWYMLEILINTNFQKVAATLCRSISASRLQSRSSIGVDHASVYLSPILKRCFWLKCQHCFKTQNALQAILLATVSEACELC